MKRTIFLLLCFWLSQWNSVSFSGEENVQFKRLSIREGLFTTLVTTVVQDRRGFLWVGTMVGLHRYNGYGFKVFTNDPGDSTSISDDWINSIVAGRSGELWIGTQNGGLNRYDPISETFAAYKSRTDDTTTLLNSGVASLCEDSEGILWIGLYNAGVCWKRPSENIIRHFKRDSLRQSLLTNTTVYSILEDDDGDVWIGTSQGLCRLKRNEKETGKYVFYDKNRFSTILPASRRAINSIYRDSRGIVYIVTSGGGLYVYDRAKDLFHPCTFGLKSKDVLKIRAYCLGEDKSGRYWIGTSEDGLFLIDPKDESIRQFKYRNDDENSLSSNTVYCLCAGDDGAMWLGTYEGISKYDYREEHFRTYAYRANNPHGLNAGSVMDVCEDSSGGLWFATHGGGLNYLPYGSKRFRYFRHDPNDASSLSTDMLMCMTKIRDDVIWTGGRSGGLMKFNIQTKKTEHFFYDSTKSSGLSNNNIMYLYQDKKGNVWIGTAAGLDRFDPVKRVFTNYRNRPNDSSSLSGNDIWSILEDSDGAIWVGTQRHGLNRLDPRTGKNIRMMSDPAKPNSIRTNSVYALHEYPPGMLWIATTGGLGRLDIKSGAMVTYTKKDGLAGNGVGTILHDSRGRLWLSIKYLTVFDPRTKKFKNFDESDGIQCGEINQESACIGKGGWMYFGGSNGYVSFHPDSIYDNTYIPPIVLTNFRVFEDSREFPRDSATGIVLSYEENYFSFEFAALSFTAPEKNMYRYKLEGYDNNWIAAGTRRYAAYAHVDPGVYVFRVLGSNNDGVWNMAGASVALRIVPPYWKTSWFRLSVLFVALFAVASVLHRRFEFLRRRAREQQELSQRLLESQENERKRIGASLHDSLGQDLLVIKNLAVLGIEAGRKKRSADEQLNEISSLASQVLAEVREISYDLRPYHLDQLGLTGALRSIISRVSSSSRIVFSEDLDEVNNLFPKEQEINIFRIVQEAVNNIVKHSRATAAAVEIKRNGDSVTFTVSDNGIGFEGSRQGFGLTGMAERVRILDGSMAMRSAAGEGTTVIVTIPLKMQNDA
jgi:signal transduction histidine kinase/ligand-binding sensor domain-containing protein